MSIASKREKEKKEGTETAAEDINASEGTEKITKKNWLCVVHFFGRTHILW